MTPQERAAWISRQQSMHREEILDANGANWRDNLPIVDAIERALAENQILAGVIDFSEEVLSSFSQVQADQQGVQDVTPFAPPATIAATEPSAAADIPAIETTPPPEADTLNPEPPSVATGDSVSVNINQAQAQAPNAASAVEVVQEEPKASPPPEFDVNQATPAPNAAQAAIVFEPEPEQAAIEAPEPLPVAPEPPAAVQAPIEPEPPVVAAPEPYTAPTAAADPVVVEVPFSPSTDPSPVQAPAEPVVEDVQVEPDVSVGEPEVRVDIVSPGFDPPPLPDAPNKTQQRIIDRAEALQKLAGVKQEEPVKPEAEPPQPSQSPSNLVPDLPGETKAGEAPPPPLTKTQQEKAAVASAKAKLSAQPQQKLDDATRRDFNLRGGSGYVPPFMASGFNVGAQKDPGLDQPVVAQDDAYGHAAFATEEVEIATDLLIATMQRFADIMIKLQGELSSINEVLDRSIRG